MECKLFETIVHGGGPNAAVYVIGEVLKVHVDESLVEESGRVGAAFRPVARLGGSNYLDLESGKVFELGRPKERSDTSR